MYAGRWVVCVGLAITTLFPACKSRKTAREQVSETIAAAEAAAEEKDLSRLERLISERYSDGSGNDRAALVQLLQLRFLRSGSIHLLVRVPKIHLASADRAEATVLAAMASTAIAGPQQLAGLSADLYRFELVLAQEEPRTWRIVSASWSPIQPSEFL